MGAHRYDTVTVVHAQQVDGAYNSTSFDWDHAQETPYAQCSVQPIASTEDMAGQDRVVTRWRLHMPPHVPVVATDRIKWAGRTFEVDGDVGVYQRRGTTHHLEMVLKLVAY